jgi:hypothetical protein
VKWLTVLWITQKLPSYAEGGPQLCDFTNANPTYDVCATNAYTHDTNIRKSIPSLSAYCLKAERGGKTWIAVQASSREEACIQASFTSWNLVLEGVLEGFLGEACNRFLLRKDTQVWANQVLMITELQASRSTEDALTTKAKHFHIQYLKKATKNIKPYLYQHLTMQHLVIAGWFEAFL